MTPVGLLDRLSAGWAKEWPQTPPIAFLLRDLYPERWVRFHSLPESKRYAETDEEHATVLLRHHAVLDELGPSARCFVIAPRFAGDTDQDVAIPDELHWRTIDCPDYYEKPVQLYATSLAYSSAEFDNILRAAAAWQLAQVIISPDDLRWLYHPYDGGADVIAASVEQRDQLKAEFRDWLSAHPGGL